MKKLLFIFVAACFSCSSGIYHITDADFFQLNTQQKYSSYNPEKLSLGACCELGELALKILPQRVEFDKKGKTILIEGRVVDERSDEPLAGVDLIVGNVKKVNETQWHVGAIYRTRAGDNGRFSLKFPLRREYRLYFAMTGYRVYEYDIGKLAR